MITVRLLRDLLDKCNPEAVVCLCVEGFPYAEIGRAIDETNQEGIGNVLLELHPRSDFAKWLSDVPRYSE